MIRRRAAALVRRRLRSFPAVALVGPRQSGKTTLARSLRGSYFDLEQSEDRVRLDVGWPDVVASRRLVVLDEVQAWPEVFARLRGAIDADRRRCGRFLLLGSVSPAVLRETSESLAGRLALCELSPLSVAEVRGKAGGRLWLHGGYPDGGVLPRRGGYPVWQRSYLDLLAQRDLPAWGLPAKPAVTSRLFVMLAATHGAIWNGSQLGASLGLSYHTVASYVDYLEHAFLVRRLPAFAGSLRKRLVRSPRVYWRDSGLLHALLGVRDMDHLLAQPQAGASWEGFVIEQALASLAAEGRSAAASYFRTSDGAEIDLVLDLDGRRFAVEIKLTTAPHPEDLARLHRNADLISADVRVLVSRTVRPAGSGNVVSTDLPGLLSLLGVARPRA